MKRLDLALGLLVFSVTSPALAGVPAGYAGKPFDPASAGGPMLLPGVKAGPYPIPGRLEFENHDMGGIGVGFFTTDHISCGAAGYRTDDGTKEASLCATMTTPDTPHSAPHGDLWYDTGDPALDGTSYPSATSTSVYVGAVRPGDWFNITVDVQTAGTYEVGSTWASGNGPLGLEGGNGAMELQVAVNGTMQLDWKATFPNYATTANFHNWKPYVAMGTVSLQAGLQVIKLTAVIQHLNLDYVQFSLVAPDGGIETGVDASSESGTTTETDAGTEEAGTEIDAQVPVEASVDSSASFGAESEPAQGADGGEVAGGSGNASGCGGCTESAALAEGSLPGALGIAAALLGIQLRRRGARRRSAPSPSSAG